MSPTPARSLLPLLALAAVLHGCTSASPPDAHAKRYELRGQVVGLRADVGEVRIAHEEIPGYMGAMTMSFSVKDRGLLAGRQRGDLVRGTLVVTDTDAWLESLEKTGWAQVVEPPANASGPAPAFTVLEPGQPVPEVALIDQDGRPWTTAQLKGKASAITFIYTRCPLPTFCPLINRHFLATQRLVAQGAARDRVHLVTVSFDPDFDTPAVLKQHAASLGADLASWRFLTGTRAAVDEFAARFGVTVMREGGGPGEITHNLRTAVIAPDGTLVTIYSGSDWTPQQLAKALEAAARR